jgi:hypothetical protein
MDNQGSNGTQLARQEGLRFLPDESADQNQTAFCPLSHRLTENESLCQLLNVQLRLC